MYFYDICDNFMEPLFFSLFNRPLTIRSMEAKEALKDIEIGFPRKYWCIVYCVDVLIIVYYVLMDVNFYDTLIY
jgi:hypothetical protein